MKRKIWRAAVAAMLAAGSIALAACGDDDDDGGNGGGSTGGGGDSASLADCTFKVGILGPFTGDAASIGQEQLNWGKFAIDKFNQANGTKFTFKEGDTQLDPAQASTVGQQMVADNSVTAIVGPSGSQEVESAGPIFDRAGMPYVSPSATKTDLAGKYKNFMRVVPDDSVQGPTDAAYMADTLGAKKVMIVDDQTSYSTGLADSVEEELKGKGVDVERTSIRRSQTDFSAVVSRVGNDVDFVFLPWQIAANAQQVGDQLKEQGKDAKVFGSDGVFSPDEFKVEGAYVSSFAPDITSIPESKDLAAEYRKEYGNFGTFGPPVYVATEVLATAAKNVCEGGNSEPSREDILSEVRNVTLSESILGQPIEFEENGNVKGAKFFIFTIKDGKFVAAPDQA